MYSAPAELIESTDRAISWEYHSCKTPPLAVFQVRNLTYMVTRREKIKRSVCKVQEQIFNSYTKQLEQERVSGMPQSSLPHVRPQGQGLLTGCEGQTFVLISFLRKMNTFKITAVARLSFNY